MFPGCLGCCRKRNAETPPRSGNKKTMANPSLGKSFTLAMKQECFGGASPSQRKLLGWVEGVDLQLFDLASSISQFSEFIHRRRTFVHFSDLPLDASQNSEKILQTNLGIYGGEATDLILLEERKSGRQKPPGVMRSTGCRSDVPVLYNSADTYRVDAGGEGIFEDAENENPSQLTTCVKNPSPESPKRESIESVVKIPNHLAIFVKSPPPESQKRESIESGVTSFVEIKNNGVPKIPTDQTASTNSTNSEDLWKPVRVIGGRVH